MYTTDDDDDDDTHIIGFLVKHVTALIYVPLIYKLLP
jgi:hypothetical protein